MFDGFTRTDIDVGPTTLRVSYGGQGPGLLLLHGHPRTHATWHRVAPALADRFTVVCPDLRGYGRSGKPATAPDHAPYAKRAMAGDCLALMRGLGLSRFAVAGHDRGAYVAFRLAMDHPDAVTRLVVMDAVPIGTALDRCDAQFAAAWWHWFFLGNPVAEAERVINADPDAWYHTARQRPLMGEQAWPEYLAAVHDPDTVHAMCEDYRAGLGIDRAHDDADRRAGRRVRCPTLILWAARDDMETLYGDPVAVWRDWAVDVRGARVDSGHHIAEEAPDELVGHLREWLR